MSMPCDVSFECMCIITNLRAAHEQGMGRDLFMSHFRKRALQKRQYSAQETYNLKEPTNRSHPICDVPYS